MKQHDKQQFQYSEESANETIQQITDAYNSGDVDQEEKEIDRTEK